MRTDDKDFSCVLDDVPAVYLLHAAGYVFGDLRMPNVMVYPGTAVGMTMDKSGYSHLFTAVAPEIQWDSSLDSSVS